MKSLSHGENEKQVLFYLHGSQQACQLCEGRGAERGGVFDNKAVLETFRWGRAVPNLL